MSALANATVDGIRLTDEEVLGEQRCCSSRATRPPPICWELPAVVLAQHRQTRRRLAADRTLGPAVEELLRYSHRHRDFHEP